MSTAKATSKKLIELRLAARQLFVSEGYHNTRPQDIARLAGVASGTFYRFFTDKQAAFLDFAEQAQQELIVCFEENLHGISGHRNRWRIIVRTVITFATEHPGVLNVAFIDPVLIAPDSEDAWRMYERMGLLINFALDDTTTFKPDYDPALISHGINGMLRHAMTYAGRQADNKEKIESLIDDLSLFIDRGLGF